MSKFTQSIADKINSCSFGLSKIFNRYSLGTELKRLSDTADAYTGNKNIGTVVKKTLVAEDIAAGVATVACGVAFTSFSYPVVLSSAGVPRAITAITKSENSLLITATDVAATDTVYVVVYA